MRQNEAMVVKRGRTCPNGNQSMQPAPHIAEEGTQIISLIDLEMSTRLTLKIKLKK
jgi:hypothetical protein